MPLEPRRSVRAILFGATGMVGAGVLAECLEDPRVLSVLIVGRTACGVVHPKVRELIRSNFFDYDDAIAAFQGHDACFFCLGVSSAGMAEATYHRLTYELTLATAKPLAELNPGLTFCYVSGEGTDSTERGRFMWARVKGKTENHLLRLPFDAYMFRPGYIQPLKGIRSKTKLYQAAYDVFGRFYPWLKRIFPTHVTTTENVGLAMIQVATSGYGSRVLGNSDINGLAVPSGGGRVRVNYAIVSVSDMKRSVSSYRDVVELSLRFESPGWTEFETDGATLALHAEEGLGPAKDDPRHFPCIQEPKETFGVKLAQYLDPDGLGISVAEERRGVRESVRP